MSDNGNDWVGQTLTGGRYRVDAKLGEGGMGFVYKVWDRNLDTDVVVKAPRKSMLDDPEFAQRFALEIRSLVKLTHPNIVKLSDVGDHEGVPFAVMQYLTGGTLDERQEYGREGRPLPAAPASLAGWLPGIAAALDFIHGKGYIHRDVKPGNILFDTHGHPYLSDFGVAKVLSDVESSSKRAPSGMTGIGIVLGTPEYMAPELIMGNKFDGKVDQYALAATAYEILCGRKPFWGETATAIIVLQTTQAPPPMVELPPAAAESITKVMLKGLAKKPGDRYPTCVEFASALVAVLAKAGTVPRPAAPRMACPTCGVAFAIPEGLDNYKGKKSRCRACGVPFRIAMDGLSLVKIDPQDGPTPSGSVEVDVSDRSTPARPNRTVKMDALGGTPEVEPVGPGRANRTMKMEAMPGPAPTESAGPARAARTMKLEAMPAEPEYDLSPIRASRTVKMQAVNTDSADSPQGGEKDARSHLPWIVGGAGVAAALILVAVLALMPSKAEPTLLAGGPLPKGSLIPPKAPSPRVPPVSLAPKDPGNPGGSASNPPGATSTVAPPATRSKNASGGFFPSGPGAPASVPPPTTLPASSPPMADGTGTPPVEALDKPDPENQPDAERPNPNLGRLAPSRNTPPKGDLSLKQIASQPDSYLNEVVCPGELLAVGADLIPRGGPDEGLKVRNAGGTYQNYVNPAKPFQIVLKQELVQQLRQKTNTGNLMTADYPAILKMRIIKDRAGNGYLGEVESLEYLYYVDPIPIAGKTHNYKHIYYVLHLDLTRTLLCLSPDFELWKDRIPIKTTNIKTKYVNEGRPDVYKLWRTQATNPVGHAVFFHKWIMEKIF